MRKQKQMINNKDENQQVLKYIYKKKHMKK